jgi:hypothetical protein
MGTRGLKLQPGKIPTQQDNGGAGMPTTLTSQQLEFLTSKLSPNQLKQYVKNRPNIGVAAGVGSLSGGGVKSQYATGGTTQNLLDIVSAFRSKAGVTTETGTPIRPRDEEEYYFNLTPEEQAEKDRLANIPEIASTIDTESPGERHYQATTQFGSGATLGAQFVGGANPFDKAARGNFSAATMLPQNLAESRAARQYIKANRIVVYSYTNVAGQPAWRVMTTGDQATGTPPGGQPATPAEFAKAEHQDQLIAQINDINLKAFEFVELEEVQRRTQEINSANADLTKERDRQMSALRVEEALNPDILAVKEKQVEEDFQNAIAEIKEEGIQRRLDVALAGEVKRQTIDRQFELDIAVQESEQAFAVPSNALDRNLQALQLEEAQRQALVVEQLDRRRQELAEKQFKMEIFSFLSASPEMLYFMKQDANLGAQFNSLLADIDESGELSTSMDSLIKTIQARPTLNIQQFSRLTEKGQDIERFSQAGQTGTTKENVEAALKGQAPARPGLPTSGETLQRLRI